jgi:hypothetical protein
VHEPMYIKYDVIDMTTHWDDLTKGWPLHMGSLVISKNFCPLVGSPLPLFMPCRSPRSFLWKLFKEKSFYFYCLPVFCSAAAASSSLSSFSLSPPSAAPLHAHQASCTLIKDGEEGRKESSFGLDCIRSWQGGSEEGEKGRILASIHEIVFPSDEVIPAPPPGFRVMFLALLLHGFSLPSHEFLRGLRFVYGVQLH